MRCPLTLEEINTPFVPAGPAPAPFTYPKLRRHQESADDTVVLHNTDGPTYFVGNLREPAPAMVIETIFGRDEFVR